MKLRFLVALSVAVSLLTGCASVQNVSLDKTSRAQLKSVALLRIGESQFFQVRDFSGMSALGGAIGGAIQGAVDDKRAKQFLQAVNDKNVKFADVMVAKLQAELQKSGIQMEYLSEKAPKLAADGKTDDYSDIATDKDAILNVWFGATGFVNTAKLSTEYQPWLVVHARLVDPKTKAIIYQKTFNAGYEAKIANAVFVSLDPKYKFGNFDDLMSRVDLGIEALMSGEALVASQIASDIK
jgi:hypothetical protein